MDPLATATSPLTPLNRDGSTEHGCTCTVQYRCTKWLAYSSWGKLSFGVLDLCFHNLVSFSLQTGGGGKEKEKHQYSYLIVLISTHLLRCWAKSQLVSSCRATAVSRVAPKSCRLVRDSLYEGIEFPYSWWIFSWILGVANFLFHKSDPQPA